MKGGFQKKNPGVDAGVLILDCAVLTCGLRTQVDAYAENDVPQPQPPVAFGFSKVKPEPIIFVV